MKVGFYTFGCKVNQYETEHLEGLFRKAGYDIAAGKEEADVYIVNSCTVTGEGDRKTGQLLRRIKGQHPGAKIVLTGCFPQAFPEKAAGFLEADLVTGAKDRTALVALVDGLMAEGTGKNRRVAIAPHTSGEAFEAMQVEAFRHRTRAFVKIEDGCDCRCSYCIIPTARGPVRSKPVADIAAEVRSLAQAGHKEVVLVGINLCSYGQDLGLRLADGVSAACDVEGIERVRLGSLEADLLTDADWERLATLPKLCPQFHLSLQSGCDETLQRMNRHYTGAAFGAMVEKARALFPGCAITTDMIVGFPGETEEEFAVSAALAQKIGFAKIHVFPYSPREGTPAAQMAPVAPDVKSRRSVELQELAAQMRRTFLQGMVGRVEPVLVEHRLKNGLLEGYTPNYTPVLMEEAGDWAGRIVDVEIMGVQGDCCLGLIQPKS